MNLSAALDESQDQTTEVLPAVAILSLEQVKPDFAKYVKRVDEMVMDAKAIEIKNDETLNIAVMLGGEAKKIAKALDAKKEDVTAEASDFVKSVNGFVKMFTDKLKDVELSVKRKVNDYQTKIELERRKQEELARKAAEKVQKEVNEEAKKAGVEAPTVAAPVIPQAPKVTRTETGTSAYQVKRWICTVTDPAAVPREYCGPLKHLLDDAVKMGVREIPGCKIEEISETRFRT